MLIVALVLAVVGLAALVTAVVTGNELIAWVCIAASVVGVILLIIDAIRERQGRDRAVEGAEPAAAMPATHTVDETYETFDAEYPETDEAAAEAAPEPVLEETDEAVAEETVTEPAADEPVEEPAAEPGDDTPAAEKADG